MHHKILGLELTALGIPRRFGGDVEYGTDSLPYLQRSARIGTICATGRSATVTVTGSPLSPCQEPSWSSAATRALRPTS